MSERATFDDLIRLKLRREEQRGNSVEIMIESLGKPLLFVAPSRDQQLDFIGTVRKSADFSGSYEAYRCLVYDCCPALHSKELHTEFNVEDPYDIIDKLFGPIEVMHIGDELADRFMMALPDDVKN